MVKYLKFNLHSLFIAITSVLYVFKESKFDSEPTISYSISLPSPPKFVTVVHGSFYKTVRTCSEPRSVERRLSFAVEVTTASGNWAPTSLENHFYCPFPMVTKFKKWLALNFAHFSYSVRSHVLYIHIYIYI